MTILLCRPLSLDIAQSNATPSIWGADTSASLNLSQNMPLSLFDLFLLFSENSPFYKLSNVTLTAEHSLGGRKKKHIYLKIT